MATAKRTTATLRNSRHNQVSLSPPSGGRIADSATCQVDFLFPTRHVQFSYLDTINVTYRSELANPALSCWCGAPGRATQKFRYDNVRPFNGSALVLLNFSSENPCWFHLTSDSGDCGDTSESFLVSPPVLPSQRSTRTAPTPPLAARADVATGSQEPASSGESFSTGAKAGLGVGIALACIGIGAMAAFLYFRRRRRAQDAADLAGAIYDHDRRRGRKAPEKNRNGASSVTSGRSDEPLCPIQPVPDGFPGSMGYDDVRSLHTTNSHSPTGVSPTLSHNGGGFWGYERGSTEREELTAARLKSQLQPSAPAVVSYGPNPVTPTLKSTSRVDLTLPGTVFPDPIETLPQHFAVKPISDYADYTVYSIPHPAAVQQPEAANTSPPKKPAVPIVVSYGPNKVTPTPLVTSPTVPPDEAFVNRRIMMEAAGSLSAVSLSSHEQRRFSWEADSPLLGGGGASLGPLPPYASTEDFEAMEKGAVRTLAEPQAEAELPPTKDGFYHYMSDAVEYELPGAAPQREPQLPFRPYQKALAAAAAQVADGPSSSGAAGGGAGGVRRNNMLLRDIDEQKFLLSDEEIAKMRALKAKARAAAAAAPKESQGAEEYDLGELQDRR